MAGAIRIDENTGWSAAGWVFDHVLRMTRKHLPEAESSKILELMDRAELPGVNYLSLKTLTTSEVVIFREALERAYQELQILGPESFNDPTFYPGFMDRFQELLDLMPKSQ